MAYFLRFSVLGIFIVGVVTACAAPNWPLQTQIRSEVERPQAYKGKPSASALPGSKAIIVGKGDSVYALSRRHSVSMRTIILANNLQPPFFLKIGQRIILPDEPMYHVKKGDTLSEIAEKRSLSLYELVRLNTLKPPYTIYAGQKLRLPKQRDAQHATKIIPSGSLAVKTIPNSLRIDKGEGEQTISSSSGAEKVSPWANVIERSILDVNVAPTIPRPPIVRSTSKPPPRSGRSFQWPVKGRVISTFGAKKKGLRNDGINIAAPRGTPVLSAENGVVVYAGNELRGFGKLILVKHAGGWVSAYAHNEILLVRRGEKVSKGQRIARVGSTGRVIVPQLHFELRKGRRARDPRKYLKPV